MPKWLKISCIGCSGLGFVVAVAVAGVLFYTYSSVSGVFEDVGQSLQTGIQELEKTNGKYEFTEPDKVNFESERFILFLMIRNDWNKVMQTHIPMDRFKELQSGERAGFREYFDFARDVIRAMGLIWTELGQILDRHRMSFSEFRWHTGNLVAALAADPVVSTEVHNIYTEMRERVRKIPSGDPQETTELDALSLKQRYGIYYDPAKSTGAETLSEEKIKELVIGDRIPSLWLDIFALKGTIKPGKINTIGVIKPEKQ